jgi:phosphoserine aminotransferase
LIKLAYNCNMSEQIITIPEELKPQDGRFGCGPSKIRGESARSLYDLSAKLMGTSHRQAPVKNLVGEIRENLTEMFSLPDGYEVILGNGGATAFWDAASFGLIKNRSEHLVFGEFSSKFKEVANNAPFLSDPVVVESPPGDCPELVADEAVDAYCLTHNETSTGVQAPIFGKKKIGDSALFLVDATSAAGGILVDAKDYDVYYFAPQKCFSSDGGLYIAICSPKAIERIEELSSNRWIPAFLDLKIALDNSRLNQTYNTPAIATLIMLREQINWILNNGGLTWSNKRTKESAEIIYTWANANSYAEPFVKNPEKRSQVVATIDFKDPLDAKLIAQILRQNGILDVEPYRKLGRNQLRVALFPSIEPSDIAILCGAINYTVTQLYFKD